jgi:hypothetical protein
MLSQRINALDDRLKLLFHTVITGVIGKFNWAYLTDLFNSYNI